MSSRRALLRALAAGTLASLAGCSQFGDFETATETTAPTTAADYEETTIMSPTTVGATAETTGRSTDATTGSTSTAANGTATDGSHPQSETTTSLTETPTATNATTASVTTEQQALGSDSGNGNAGGSSNGSNDSQTTTTTATTTATKTTSKTTETTVTTTDGAVTSTTIATTTTPDTTTTTTTEPTTTEDGPDSKGQWATVADLPRPQSNPGGGVLDGSLYCFGGIESGENLPAVARSYRFDPATGDAGAWHRIEDMPRALWAPCGVAAGDTLYSFGGAPTDAPYGTGEPPSDEIFAYEPGEGWRDLTAEAGVRCPYPNWAMSGVYNPADGLIYLVGGGTDVTGRASASDHGVGTDAPGTYDESRVWTFDPESETVADPDRARLPRARRWPTVALTEVDGEPRLHAICGLFGVTGPTDDNLRYRLSSGEWESMTPAPRAGIYATNADPVVDDTLYLTHGFFWKDDPSTDAYTPACHAYDPATDAFRTDFAQPGALRGGAVDGVVDGRLYVAAGHVKRYDQNGYHDCKTAVEAFTPPR